MEVRASLNAENNLAIVTGEGEKSFVENDSFFAKAPPQAASTVGRTKTRRLMQHDSDMGSFLDDMPGRTISPFDIPAINGARPKVTEPMVGEQTLERNREEQIGQNIDWSVVNAWCRDNKSDYDKSSQDERSSLGIINIDEMDLSTNNLLLETPLDELRRHDTEKESSTTTVGSSIHRNSDCSESSTLRNNTPSDLLPWKHDGSSSNNSHDTKQDQPFARSQINTVKKIGANPKPPDPITAAIRHSLFGQMTIGEEGEEKDTSVYNVELQAEELNEIDNDFGEINLSDNSEDESSTPVAQTVPKMTVSGDEIRLNSVYFRPGVNGEEQTASSLPFLSKVSLFEGGSGSEIDTEDELEQARKEQGARHEAAGEASDRESSRPGLEGDCSDDHSGNKRLPITQRQSAEGDVVSSPVPGDGGGGGDGSSGSESDDGRQSRATTSGRGSSGYASNLPSNRQSQNIEQEEQRIRPMGDDLLSEMRFSKYEASANRDSEDTRLASRYLARISPVEDTNPDSMMMEDFLESQNQTGEEEDFFPGNRLEASGFNADDFPVLNFQQKQDTGNNSNPFGQLQSSFGSFGLSPGPGGASQFQGESQPQFDSGQQINGLVVEALRSHGQISQEEKDKRSSAEQSWTQLIGSTGNSMGSKQNSLGSEPRTSGDIGPSASLYEQTDYARLGSEERGSLGRSSGSGSPARSFSGQGMIVQPNVNNISLGGFDASLRKSGSKSELKESSIFKKPFLPAPKAAAVFTKSVAKSKTYQSGSYHGSSGKASGQSSSSSVRSEMSDFKNDLAFRLSFTNEAEEQRVGLKRVPSVGESNTMDLTVNDEDFFDNADALAMLDQDEKQFEEENVFRQDDAMADNASPGESWAYKSIMSIARPSWLDDLSNEEKVVVRISVGSYMRGRTEALGSLDGDENVKRPDFGMTITSPEKADEKPARLIEEDDVFDETRTSGVGQQYSDSQNRPYTATRNEKIPPVTPKRIDSENVDDYTFTMDSLMKTPRADPNMTDATGLYTDRSMAVGNATLTSEVSAFLKRDSDIKTIYTKFMASQPKCEETGKKQESECIPASPSKSSHLPIKKGSTLKQSLRSNEVNRKPSFSAESLSPKSSVYQRTSGFSVDQKSSRKVPHENSEKCVSPKASSPDDIPDNVWSSPNTSNYRMPHDGLFDRMDEFQFSGNHQSSEKSNLSGQQLQDIKETLKAQYSLAGVSVGKVQKDREKTPPPDGEDQRPHRIKGLQKDLQSELSEVENLKAGNESPVVEASVSGDMSSTKALPSKNGKSIQRNVIGFDPRQDISQNVNDTVRLKNNSSDHGYMPGHHIPDGTAYSQRSDYSHMDHKGMSREDVAGVDDIGLAESRGFDMLQRKRDHVISERKPQNEETREQTSRSNDSIFSVRPVQSFKSLPKNVTSQHGSMSQTGSITNQSGPEPDFTKTDETNSRIDINKLESWTQTSLVFSQDSELQPDSLIPHSLNRDSHFSSSTQKDGHFQSLPNDSFNMTDNMKSQHYCNPDVLQNEPEKLHLLTKNTSLLKTKFAQDNLKRNFGIEVMERIYSNKSIPDDIPDFPSQTDDKRWSFQSAADWTHLQGHLTMDASHIRLSDVGNLHHRLPSAQSTPMPNIIQGSLPTSQYSMLTTIPTGDNMTQYSILSTTDSHLYKTQGRVILCPVESPGVLKFKDVCCVGISKTQVLPLKNPTDRWMECIIQVVSLEIDGQASLMDNFPFELRQKKIIIDPYKLENVDIIFLPKRAGAYVAQVQIFSRAFTKADDQRKDTIPVNVTFQAIAEEPWIKVQCEDDQGDTLDFGEMEWGSCTEKTISLKNMGYATVPLRLAITSTKGWHCFCFEPESRMSDVSIISGRHVQQSGQGKAIVNLSLSGCKEHFDYHTVKVWCRPPEKQCTRMMARQPAEQLCCNIDVEVDIPCCKFPKLASLRMKATVGVKKLHIQSKLKEIQLSASPNISTETSVKLFNAGNLNLDITFGFTEHKSLFTVAPARLHISPGVDAELKVGFKPTEYSTSKFSSLLLMMVLPQGPMFELKLQGSVMQKKSIPYILCDCTDMDFGGVAIGKSVVKRYRLINKGDEPLTMTAEARVDDLKLLLSPNPSSIGSKKIELYLPPGETLPVYAEFSPTQPVSLCGKIVMKPKDDITKYVVKVRGYGGVSRLSCLDSTRSIQGYPCVCVDDISRMNELYIRNIGAQAASVKLALYSDLKCSQRLTSGQTVIQPSEFMIEAQQKKVLELVTSLSQRELAAKCDTNGLLAVARLSYKDVVDSTKPHGSDLTIGIVLNNQPGSQVSSTYTPCKSTQRFPQSSRVSQPLQDTTAYRTMENVSSLSSDNGLWNVTPQDLILYCSKKGSCDQMRMCNIINNTNKDLRFEISWPGDMLSVVPGQGLVKPRENTYVQIFPSSKASNMLDQLPWSGKVAVMANDVIKIIKVNVRHDSSGDENEPVQEDSRLVPVPTSIPQTGSSSNKLGHLEVSRTNVMFTLTCAGKVSEESLWLKNDGPDMLRWMFSSFASPYLQKTADKTKEMFRVSYKVFDFSRQFGKLNGHDTVQLTVKFMPRSSGTFSQYWDLQFIGNSGGSNTAHRQDFIRIHFTGEAFEEPESRSKAASITKDIIQSFSSDTRRLILCNDKMTFSQTRPESCVIQKVEIKNTYMEDVKAEVIAPAPPFYVKHQHFTVAKRRYLRFPVEFRPTRPGKFSDKVKFQSSKGDNLIMYLYGECS